MAASFFLTSTYTGCWMAPRATRSTENLHTHVYLNPGSHHHPSNMQAVLADLVHRTRALCDQKSLRVESEFLKTIFKENGYSFKQIQHALNQEVRMWESNDQPSSVGLLHLCPDDLRPPQENVGQRQHPRVLARRKISMFLCLVKNNLGLRTPGVYSIQCGQVSIRQDGQSLRDQNKGSPLTRMAWTSRQIGIDRTQV